MTHSGKPMENVIGRSEMRNKEQLIMALELSGMSTENL